MGEVKHGGKLTPPGRWFDSSHILPIVKEAFPEAQDLLHKLTSNGEMQPPLPKSEHALFAIQKMEMYFEDREEIHSIITGRIIPIGNVIKIKLSLIEKNLTQVTIDFLKSEADYNEFIDFTEQITEQLTKEFPEVGKETILEPPV